jgi:glutamyl-tRNA reductase
VRFSDSSDIGAYKVMTLTHNELDVSQLHNVLLPNMAEAATEHAALKALSEACGMDELLYLNTCNRVLYFFVKSDLEALDLNYTTKVLSQINPNLSEEQLEFFASKFLVFEGIEAIRHVFSVASSLESLVVGEREIFRQFREAYDFCLKQQTTSDNLRLAMRFLVETVKEVHTYTEIGSKSVSVVALAYNSLLADNLPLETPIALLGAGVTNALMLKLLHKKGYQEITLYNRTLARAQTLAEGYQNVVAAPLTDFGLDAKQYRLIVAATDSKEPLVSTNNFNSISPPNTPIHLVDLSSPPNISAELKPHPQVKLIDIDALRELADENIRARQGAITEAKKVITKRVNEFETAFNVRQLERIFKELPTQIKQIEEKATQQLFKDDYQALDPNAKETLDKILKYILKGAMSAPIILAKSKLK